MSGPAPLSPSLQPNVLPPAPAPASAAKPLILEEEDDFYAPEPTSAQATAPLSPSAAPVVESVLAEPVASSSRAAWSSAVEVELNRAPGRGSNGAKSGMMLEEDDGFYSESVEDGDVVMQPAEQHFWDESRPSISKPAARKVHLPSYASQYASLSAVDLTAPAGGRSSLRSIEAAPVQATTLSGKRVFLKRQKRRIGYVPSAADKREDAAALAALSNSMLETPYAQMMLDLEKGAIMAKKQAEADEGNTALQDELQRQAENPEKALWTDRYRPKRFTDLLGDERVHRTALLWLKEWDECVFKGSNKTSVAAELSKERRKKRAREAFGGGADQPEREPDPLGRPHEKILLLAGPPGLGKTTLAYVLARQAGYQVLEINASDDRTGRVVDERIRNALESRAITATGGLSGSKPTCVIIDEVDGAGGGGESSFVRSLVKLVENGTAVKKYKGKGKRDLPLVRPIICICNDLYAPVLRPLRPLAKIIRFSPPTNAMLVSRLRTICSTEQLTADSKHLTLLAETAEGDLRSCLNTLQFIKRRTNIVDKEAIRSVVGQKDTGTSAQQVLERLFKKPQRKKGVEQDDTRFVHRIVRDVQTSGEYDKISQGCFENYLTAKQVNEAFPRILEALDWLNLYDRLDSKLRADRDYELLAYVPYAFAPWHKLFATHTAKPLEYPKSDYEAFQQRVAHEEIVSAFKLNLPHQLKGAFTGTNVVAELLPLLNRILNPEMKPVNSQLVKSDEKQTLHKLVQLMLAVKLAFVQDKNEDGQLTYKLEPPIDVFIHFDGKRASDMAPSRYAVRHMIAREMDAELLRRGGGTVPGGTGTTAGDIISAYNVKPQGGIQAAQAPVKAATDFFGRTIVTKTAGVTPSQAAAGEGLAVPPPAGRRKAHAVYKYHEGFSNAVRTTKRVADFLGV